MLVECKDRKWLKGGKRPSATISAFNEAMLLFYLAPKGYRKILFLRRDYSPENKESLAEYYVKSDGHLIPNGVEVWEYDDSKSLAAQVYPKT